MKHSFKLISIFSLVVLAGCSYIQVPGANSNEIVTKDSTSNSFNIDETVDERIPLTDEQYEILSKDNKFACKAGFNSDTSDEVVQYINAEYNFSLDIPYNSDWGTANYYIFPYEWREDGISFGPLRAGEACGWYRDYTMDFIEARSVEEIVSALKSDPEYPNYYSQEPTIININNYQAVKYSKFGLADHPFIEVVGDKVNLLLSKKMSSGKRRDSDLAQMENILASLKFITNDSGFLQNSVDTANWQEYDNKEYGFSIKYPQDWIVKNNDSFIRILSLESAQALEESPTAVTPDLFINLYPSFEEVAYITSSSLIESLQAFEVNGEIYNLVIYDENFVRFEEDNAHWGKPQTTYFLSNGEKLASIGYINNSKYEEIYTTIMDNLSRY